MNSIKVFGSIAVVAAFLFITLTSMKMEHTKTTGAYLEITLDVKAENRGNAGGVYVKYKQPFLSQIKGATSKDLLIRTEDVQVLHGFETEADAQAYLSTALFANDIVTELKPYLEAAPEVRIYSVYK